MSPLAIVTEWYTWVHISVDKSDLVFIIYLTYYVDFHNMVCSLCLFEGWFLNASGFAILSSWFHYSSGILEFIPRSVDDCGWVILTRSSFSLFRIEYKVDSFLRLQVFDVLIWQSCKVHLKQLPLDGAVISFSEIQSEKVTLILLHSGNMQR